MPFPRSHIYVTWGGVAWGTEIWQNGVRFDRQTAVTEAELELVADALAEFFTTGTAGFSSRVSLDWVKAALIGTDGRYPDTAEATLYDYDPPFTGPLTGSNVAPQLSIAVTFDTDRRRGLGHQGRIYLPPTGIATNTTGRHGSGASIAADTVTLLSAMQEALDAQAVVGSNGESPNRPARPGVFEPITSIRVGDVYDTQRRRRNRLVETYSTPAPLPPA